ncbi:hypothetical protein CFE70_002867 [Pyrenophora teres f. teres 0-1]|uniref:CCHC-type domain-containing protein n=1 Tax=Pyrenophora teres f. teres (strain 0-1) TaxID=861557 RepID=E3RDV3_PYRTT|nr:hypothetical protein PTT_03106 [Pyrenophora teres f. teres 0-1]
MAKGRRYPLTSGVMREVQPGIGSFRDDKAPPDVRTYLVRVERTLEEVLFRLRFNDIKKRNLPPPYKIRYRLAADADLILVKQLGRPGIIERLRTAGAPFDLIRGCKWDIPHKTLHLQLAKAQDEELVLKRVEDIGVILGLSRDCGYIPEAYCVHVFGMEWERQSNQKPTVEELKAWGKENGNITICSAYWTYKKLIFVFEKRSDAQKMIWQDQIFLSGTLGYSEAYDKRSTPMHCYNCGSPEHLRRGCSKRQCCLNCNVHGHYQWGCKADPLCPNCGGPHPAWAPQCVAAANIEMNAQCQQYRDRELAWSIRPDSNMPPPPPSLSAATPQVNAQVATSKQPKKKGGKKAKAAKSLEQPEDVPVKPKYNPVLQMYNDNDMAKMLASSMENADVDLGALGLPAPSQPPPKVSGEAGVHLWSSFGSKIGMKSAWNPQTDHGPVSTRLQRHTKLPKFNDDESQPYFPGQGLHMNEVEHEGENGEHDEQVGHGEDDELQYEDIENGNGDTDMDSYLPHRNPGESDSDYY